MHSGVKVQQQEGRALRTLRTSFDALGRWLARARKEAPPSPSPPPLPPPPPATRGTRKKCGFTVRGAKAGHGGRGE